MLTPQSTPGNTQWFVRDRFGLFIHWGLYALGARHEWLQNNEEIPPEVYEERYLRRFDPDLYDPDAWAQAAADAGMKYFVITTKHHEGFCLWDSKLTDYKATRSAAGRDVLRPMVEAFRRRRLKVGFYHSLIDWHHPDYLVDPHIGPLRNRPDRAALNAARRQERYAEYLHGQVRELLTEFGVIDILWLDFSYPKPDGSGKGRADWQSEKLYALVRQLQPQVILNDRLDLDAGWDIKTPEQFQPREWIRHNGAPVVWEACQTFSGSWGYHRDEQSWKSVDQLVRMLIDTVSKGGNLLLNVGPTARGEFDDRALERLRGVGEWMRRHSRSIYGCTQAPADFKTPADCRLTYHPETRRLYVHVFAWPFVELHLAGFAGKVEYAQLLNDASEIPIQRRPEWQGYQSEYTADVLTLRLPVQKPNVTVPVIELFLK
jgi:alpha-L-fucosidase